MDLGDKIKQQRKKLQLTLKDLSEQTDLSSGFLSQLERGLTTVALDSLNRIADALKMDTAYFLPSRKKNIGAVIKSFQRDNTQVINNQFINSNLQAEGCDLSLLPRYVEILPTMEAIDAETYHHDGEEFVFILEGILTLKLGNEKTYLYPGDSAHYPSSTPHNWANETSSVVRLVSVNSI